MESPLVQQQKQQIEKQQRELEEMRAMLKQQQNQQQQPVNNTYADNQPTYHNHNHQSYADNQSHQNTYANILKNDIKIVFKKSIFFLFFIMIMLLNRQHNFQTRTCLLSDNCLILIL